MTDFLSEILEFKKSEIEAAAKRVPERVLRDLAERPRASGAFIGRLAEPGPHGINIIAEIKRASPSKGRIRENIDPADYARKYQAGGAAAISVLTDNNFFGGSIEDLEKVKGAVTIPALRKDFLISSYQVYESAAKGADAVLLIVRALSPESLKDLLALCAGLGLDALVEAHDEGEYEIAAKAGARLIGINNRNLRTFETDISTSVKIAARISPDQMLVAESGIHSRDDIERLLDAGIWNFLIGESIVSSEDPVAFLKVLHGVKS